MKTTVMVANHGRDLTLLKASLPKDVEFIEINRGFERSKQRNMGIAEATGDIIIWLDSDQSISYGLVNECERLIRRGYTAIYVPEKIIAKSFFGKIRAFEREFLTGTHVDVPRVIRKDSFPLFDETMSGPEDADMGQRIVGDKTTSRNVLYHHDDISFTDYVKKKAYYTKSMKRYAQKWANDPCINFKYRCWTVFTENSKWKKLLRHPILTLGVIFLLGVRGIVYFTNR
jgi:glycosyltransferase involved in cell wall biosynthesis